MLTLILKLFRGHIRTHALESLLCLVGIALGVAVVVGIDLAVAACVSSFASAVDTLADRATHSITAKDDTLTDNDYLTLANATPPLSTPLSPIIDRRIAASKPVPPNSDVASDPLAASRSALEVPAHLLGIDPFAEKKLRTHTRLANVLTPDAFNTFLTQPNQVVLVAPLAEKLHVTTGDSLTLTINTHQQTVTIAGIATLQPPANAQLPDLLIADISTAQELTGAIGKLDRIDALIQNPTDEATLRAHLPKNLTLTSTDDRSKSLADLTAAYRLNLYALSLMASLVAVFIVYNAMLISVQQRSLSLAILRSLGSSRSQLASIYLIEALVFALLGATLGIAGGFLIAKLLVGYIATTINDLYANVRPGPVSLDALTAAKGLAVALASGLFGAIIPLYHASRTQPVSLMSPTNAATTARRSARIAALVGIAFLLLTAALPYFPTQSPLAGFVMAVTAAFGFALLCPLLTQAAAALLDTAARARQSLPVRMAAAGVSRSLGITGVAVAAMMLALAMSIGIQTMVANFRSALDSWMAQRFQYDLFLAPRLAVDYHADATLEPTLIDWVRQQPDVAELVTSRYHDADFHGQPIQIFGTQISTLLADQTLGFKAADPSPFNPHTMALISEPLAGKLHLRVNDPLTLDTPEGPLPLIVHAIYFDFRSERGQLMIDADLYAKAFHKDGASTLHVRLKDPTKADATADRWSRQLAQNAVVVKSFVTLKSDILNIFDRTFKVTDVLAWLAGGVAFCGLAGALIALSLARAKEYAILTALGLSRPQTAAWLLAESLLIATTAAAIAILAGSLLAYILANIIQYRSFGWSIPTHLRPHFWLTTTTLATTSAVLASLYPLHMLKKLPPAHSLRQQ